MGAKNLDHYNNALEEADKSNKGPSYVEQGLSLTLDCTPGVGIFKSACELVVGSDLITGEKTSRLISAIGVIPGVKILKNSGKGVKKIYDISYKTISTGFNAIKSSFKRRGAENVNSSILLNRKLMAQEIAGGHGFGKT